MIMAVIYTVFAAVQFGYGHDAGGWDTNLGSLHYWFGLYVATDVFWALVGWYTK